MGGQSLFLCDEILTGLDSATTTFDIMQSLRKWCCTLGGSSVVELFDNIVMVN